MPLESWIFETIKVEFLICEVLLSAENQKDILFKLGRKEKII
jgi:hypothetical protein